MTLTTQVNKNSSSSKVTCFIGSSSEDLMICPNSLSFCLILSMQDCRCINLLEFYVDAILAILFILNENHDRGCVKKSAQHIFQLFSTGLICLKWLHLTSNGPNRVDIDHILLKMNDPCSSAFHSLN